jgi:hypothetical protein
VTPTTVLTFLRLCSIKRCVPTVRRRLYIITYATPRDKPGAFGGASFAEVFHPGYCFASVVAPELDPRQPERYLPGQEQEVEAGRGTAVESSWPIACRRPALAWFG